MGRCPQTGWRARSTSRAALGEEHDRRRGHARVVAPLVLENGLRRRVGRRLLLGRRGLAVAAVVALDVLCRAGNRHGQCAARPRDLLNDGNLGVRLEDHWPRQAQAHRDERVHGAGVRSRGARRARLVPLAVDRVQAGPAAKRHQQHTADEGDGHAGDREARASERLEVPLADGGDRAHDEECEHAQDEQEDAQDGQHQEERREHNEHDLEDQRERLLLRVVRVRQSGLDHGGAAGFSSCCFRSLLRSHLLHIMTRRRELGR